MIINTGGRTDTVRYYTKWLLKRFGEGYVLSRNPLLKAFDNYKFHNPDSPLLLGELKETDEVIQGAQKSFLI